MENLFCNTSPSVPVFHMMMANMYGRNMQWKIKDERIERMNYICVECVCL